MPPEVFPVTDESPSPLDLSAWASETMPGLVDAEAAEDWCSAIAAGSHPSNAPERPVAGLLSETSPLSVFLRAPDVPPEGLGRAERKAFFDDWRAAQAAAVEAVEDATEHHAQLVEWNKQRQSARHIDSLIHGVQEKSEGPEVPVRGRDLPAPVGLW